MIVDSFTQATIEMGRCRTHHKKRTKGVSYDGGVNSKKIKNKEKVLTDVGRDDIIYKLSARTTRNSTDS